MNDLIASSGTLISTALESVGYYYQSHILDSMTYSFATSIGGLIILIGGIVCVGTYLLSGEYKNMLWLLVAPGLFMSCIVIRTETYGSRWKFGEDKGQVYQDKVSQQIDFVLRKTDPDFDLPRGPAKISKLFAVYNKTISSIVNEFIRVINYGRDRPDESFIIRDQLFAAMNFSSIHDRGFIDLFHAGFLDNCAALLENGKVMIDSMADSCERCHSADMYSKILKPTYALTPAAYNYVASLYLRYGETLVETAMDYAVSNKYCVSDKIIDACGGEDSLATQCGQKGMGDFPNSGLDYISCPAAMNVVPILIPAMLVSNITNTGIDLINTIGNLLSGNLVSEAHERFVDKRDEIEDETFSCPQIWGLVYLGAHHHAIDVYNYAITTWDRMHGDSEQIISPMFSPSAHRVFKLFAAWVGTDEPFMSISQIALRLLRKEYQKGSIASIEAQYVNQHSAISRVSVPEEGEDSVIKRSRSSEASWSERSRLLVSATTLPYYQGLGLFFLAVVFPFFAILLLIPGKQSGFFLWFGLWAWFKSWDVAFSIVMLLGDVIYSMFAVNIGSVLKNFYFNLGLQPDMAMAIYSIRAFDPSYDLTTYYHIVSVCLLSIPSITGYVIMGVFRGGHGLISEGSSLIQINQKYIRSMLRSGESLVRIYEDVDLPRIGGNDAKVTYRKHHNRNHHHRHRQPHRHHHYGLHHRYRSHNHSHLLHRYGLQNHHRLFGGGEDSEISSEKPSGQKRPHVSYHDYAVERRRSKKHKDRHKHKKGLGAYIRSKILEIKALIKQVFSRVPSDTSFQKTYDAQQMRRPVLGTPGRQAMRDESSLLQSNEGSLNRIENIAQRQSRDSEFRQQNERFINASKSNTEQETSKKHERKLVKNEQRQKNKRKKQQSESVRRIKAQIAKIKQMMKKIWSRSHDDDSSYDSTYWDQTKRERVTSKEQQEDTQHALDMAPSQKGGPKE